MMPDEQANSSESLPQIPPWLEATSSDFETTDLEAPLANSELPDAYDLSMRFLAAMNDAKAANQLPAARVYSMLNAVTSMHFKPAEAMEPFGPMMVGPRGRSAIADDFRGEPSAILLTNLARFKHPVLRARIADLCWILNRKRSEAAVAAMSAYLETLEQIDKGILKSRFSDDGALGHDYIEILRRTLQIGRQIGWEKEPTRAARALVVKHRQRAVNEGAVSEIRELSELDLDFGVSDPTEVATDIEAAVQTLSSSTDFHQRNWLWKLAAKGYHYGKHSEAAEHAWIEAAECLVGLAESQFGNAMFAAHWLGMALSEYQRVKGYRGRKTELRHKLIDTQARIVEQMSPFRHETNIREIVENVQQTMLGKTLMGMLKQFVLLARPPQLDKLREAAAAQIQKFPLSSLFAITHLDHEGKTIHRSPGAGGFGEADEGAIENQIEQNEKIRRGLVATGQIEVAREIIITTHTLREADLLFICENSPFIPDGHIGTYAYGFARFFQGDMLGAIYALVPQLENSLRHVLKAHGHDVTKMDLNTLTQEDRTISGLFEQMRTELDSIFGIAITGDIERVFLSKAGPHIRHQVAHGLLHDSTPFGDDARYACWLIFHLVCAPLIRHWAELEEAYSQIFSTS